MTRDGGDVTAQYRRGAEEALRLCRLLGCEAALLKERSPSCGSGMVYDGTFTGVLTAGEGVTAELLRSPGHSGVRRVPGGGVGGPHLNRPDSHGRRSAGERGGAVLFLPGTVYNQGKTW